MSAITVAVTSGTTDSVAEALRLIRTVHPDADETTVRVCDANNVREGPRTAANIMISSLGVGAIVRCISEDSGGGVKRCAPTVRVHYAYYAAPQ